MGPPPRTTPRTFRQQGQQGILTEPLRYLYFYDIYIYNYIYMCIYNIFTSCIYDLDPYIYLCIYIDDIDIYPIWGYYGVWFWG